MAVSHHRPHNHSPRHAALIPNFNSKLSTGQKIEIYSPKGFMVQCSRFSRPAQGQSPEVAWHPWWAERTALPGNLPAHLLLVPVPATLSWILSHMAIPCKNRLSLFSAQFNNNLRFSQTKSQPQYQSDIFFSFT